MGLYKRGEVWWYSFFQNGRRIQRSSGKTNKKAAAIDYANAMQGLKETKPVEEAKPIEEVKPAEVDHIFEDLRERYMEFHSRRTKAAGSISRDEYSFKQLEKSFTGMRLKELTPMRISEYKERRRKDGATEATLAKELQLLRNALNIAMREWEWIETTPFLKVKIEVPKNAIERYLTPAEEEALLKACPDWLKDIVLFAINTGMRRGEILSLRWPQVDLERKVVTLLKTKNKEKRSVPVNAKVYELLKGKVTKRSNSGLVFPSGTKNEIDPHNLERAFRAAREKAGLLDVRFHDLRHTAGSRMAQAGVDIYTISKILGHKTLTMTMRYAHHNVESLRHGVDALLKVQNSTATVAGEFACAG